MEEVSTDLARMNTAPEKGSIVFVTAAETRGFGSWMLVECKFWRQSREPRNLGKNNQGEQSSGSHFRTLNVLEKKNEFCLLGKEDSTEPIINVNNLVNSS